MRMSRSGWQALCSCACACLVLAGIAQANVPSDDVEAVLLDDSTLLVEVQNQKSDVQSGPALPPGGAEPRGVCNDLVYSNPVDATIANVAFGNLGVNSQWGQRVGLLTGNHKICRIEGKFATVEGTAGAPPVGTNYQVEMTITNVCRHTGAAGGCNASAHTILYGPALMDAPLQVTAAPLGLASVVTGVWTLPPEVTVNVLQCELIAIEFKALTAGTLGVFDNSGPVIGTSPTGFSLCVAASGQNGCSFTFSNNRSQTCFDVFADPVLGGGSCCDRRTGLCSQVASVDECSGGSCPPPLGDKVFTPGGTCQTPDPGDIECDIPLGACCVLADGTCTTQLSFDCFGAGLEFGLGKQCAETICPSECQDGGDGQPYDYRVGRVISDLNPIINGFSGVTPGGIRNADNFVPTVDGTITSIRWWGLYNNPVSLTPCPTPDSADNFSIRVFVSADILGLGYPRFPVPGDYDGVITRQATGYTTAAAVFGEEAIHQYEATGLSIPVFAGQCYWLEIYNQTSGACLWRWMLGPLGDNVFAQDSGPLPYDNTDGTGDRFVGDLAWCMNIDVNPDGCTTANPAGLNGACCLDADPFCSILAPTACSDAGGVAFGIGFTCPSTICEGACCVGGACQQLTGNACATAGGEFYGVGVPCDPTPCFGACCSFDGLACNDVGQSLNICNSNAGAFWPGEVCANVNCGQTFVCDPNLVILACGESTAVNTTALAQQNPQPAQPVTQSCFGGGANVGPGVFWVAFLGTGDDVKVSLCNSDSSDTVLSVYTRADNDCNLLSNADEVACSEDETGCGLNNLLSEVCVPNTVLNQTYWVLAGGFDVAAAGIIVVDITCPCTTCATCLGDVSGDSQRDGEDIQAFINALGSANGCADYDTNGVVNELDVDGFVDDLLITDPCP